MYAFAKLSDGKLAMYEWNDETMYAAVVALRSQNPSLKVLISVGGWNVGSAPFSEMANNDEARARFVSSSVEFLQQYGFDGLDLDWASLYILFETVSSLLIISFIFFFTQEYPGKFVVFFKILFHVFFFFSCNLFCLTRLQRRIETRR
jgi:hypothetical protein